MDKIIILGKGRSSVAYENENIVLLTTKCPLKIEFARQQIQQVHLPVYHDLGEYEDGMRILGAPRYRHVKWRNEYVVRDFYRRASNLIDFTPRGFLENIKKSKHSKELIAAVETIINVAESIPGTICQFDFVTKNYMKDGSTLILNDIFSVIYR